MASDLKFNVELAPDLARLNRRRLSVVQTCGCYHCLGIFRAFTINKWADHERTALCPVCGIDSVLPGITSWEKLEAANARWFGETKTLGGEHGTKNLMGGKGP